MKTILLTFTALTLISCGEYKSEETKRLEKEYEQAHAKTVQAEKEYQLMLENHGKKGNSNNK